MDDCNSNQSGLDPGTLRIMDARRKKRRIKTGRAKEMIALGRQETYWGRRCRNTEYIPLKEPVQRGWRRSFYLSEETARGKHAAFFEGILAVVNKIEYSNDKRFTKKKRKAGRKIRVPQPQFLKEISDWYWRKAPLSEAQRQLFVEVCRRSRKGERSVSYAFSEPWRFVLRVRPNMLTHTKQIDTVAEQRNQEIKNRIERNMLRPAMNKARSKDTNYRWKDEPNSRWKRTVHQYLDDLYTEKELTDHYPPIATAARTIAGRFFMCCCIRTYWKTKASA